MKINPIVKQIFNDLESDEIYKYLETKEFQYHKPYKRYNKIVKVPRGQMSFTMDSSIHYDYGKVAGGSPPNELMDEKLLAVTGLVNKALGTSFNTILMNVYKDGKDSIGAHADKENGWAPGSGFATLSFGTERNFVIIENSTGEKTKILHKKGMVIEMPWPMNMHYEHAVPPAGVNKSGVEQWRISLTFREIMKS